MTPEEWWKNFALGLEVDAAGAFIYNGIRTLHEMSVFNHPEECFEVLYNLSVGIERLLKVAIILTEHDEQVDVQALETSLISHSTIDLLNRANVGGRIDISVVHNEFLSLLSKFYKTHRYGRYSLSAVPNIRQERDELVKFLEKYLNYEAPLHDEFQPIPNTDQVRRFVGRTVKKISDQIFEVIKAEARRLNIYTHELRAKSKALKVFYGENLDFIDRDLIRKELIIFLISELSNGNKKSAMQSVEALSLDENSIPIYIRGLLNDMELSYAEGEVEELYAELSGVKERLAFLSYMDDDYFAYEDNEYEEEVGVIGSAKEETQRYAKAEE